MLCQSCNSEQIINKAELSIYSHSDHNIFSKIHARNSGGRERERERNFVGAEMEVFTNGHLNGSTGADSSRRAAASKHSVASCNEAAEPLALWSTPRLYHAE